MKAHFIAQTVNFVQHELEQAEAGHDWFHVERVWKNCRLLLQFEQADELVVELAALLHDLADSKFHEGDESLGPKKAGDFLKSIDVPIAITEHVLLIIKNMSFRSSLEPVSFHSKEMEIVQDADRLDAIGAIGIARAFHYGGYKNRLLYDPSVEPKLKQTKEEYKNSQSPTLNHFYEKLVLLKDRMNTVTGKNLAEGRHQYMLAFLDQFLAEWEGRK